MYTKRSKTLSQEQIQCIKATLPLLNHSSRNSSTSLLNSSANLRCRLCFPSGIRCNLDSGQENTSGVIHLLRGECYLSSCVCVCVSHRDPLMCLRRYCGWKLGTMGSFSPWIMRVGQLISGSSSVQMLPGRSRFNTHYLSRFEGKNFSCSHTLNCLACGSW